MSLLCNVQGSAGETPMAEVTIFWRLVPSVLGAWTGMIQTLGLGGGGGGAVVRLLTGWPQASESCREPSRSCLIFCDPASKFHSIPPALFYQLKWAQAHRLTRRGTRCPSAWEECQGPVAIL